MLLEILHRAAPCRNVPVTFTLDLMHSTGDDSGEQWIRNYLEPRHPDLVASYRDARAIHSKELSGVALARDETERLIEYARSERTPLGENVAALLGELFAKRSSLGAAIRTLAAGTRVHERINALVALSRSPTTELHVELLSILLHDRSGRVRALAADKIVSHGIVQLASALEEAASRESDAKVREELRANLDYLLHGFHVEKVEDRVFVTCRPPNWSSTSRIFTVDDFAREGEAWIQGVLKEASAR